MGKGASKKRRLANAAKANWGNLHKAALGKASRYMPLPAPPKEDDFKDAKMSASMRKMLALKAEVDAPSRKRKASSMPISPVIATEPRSGNRGENASTSGQVSDVLLADKGDHATQDGASEPGAQAHPKGLDTGPTGVAESLYKDPATSQNKKAKRKEYMKQKAVKRKEKAPGSATRLTGQQAPVVTFGVAPVAQPLQVQLKRKNHVAKGAQSQGERCKAIFLKQLAQAQQCVGADEHVVSDGGKAQGQGKSGLRHAQQLELLRQQYVDTYRAQKSAKKPGTGKADLASLSKLSSGIA